MNTIQERTGRTHRGCRGEVVKRIPEGQRPDLPEVYYLYCLNCQGRPSNAEAEPCDIKPLWRRAQLIKVGQQPEWLLGKCLWIAGEGLIKNGKHYYHTNIIGTNGALMTAPKPNLRLLDEWSDCVELEYFTELMGQHE